MKTLIHLTIPTAVMLAACSALQGQGFVAFHNSTSTRITSALTGRPIFGTNTYRFGLYVGPLGSTAAELTLVGIATNRPSTSATDPFYAGYFNGGSPFVLPPPHGGFVEISFQVRGWSFAGGTSYEVAYASALAGDSAILLGKSDLGFVNPGHFTQPPPNLFGPLPGEVGGFVLAPIPEPSAVALAGLGLAALVWFHGRPQRAPRNRGGT